MDGISAHGARGPSKRIGVRLGRWRRAAYPRTPADQAAAKSTSALMPINGHCRRPRSPARIPPLLRRNACAQRRRRRPEARPLVDLSDFHPAEVSDFGPALTAFAVVAARGGAVVTAHGSAWLSHVSCPTRSAGAWEPTDRNFQHGQETLRPHVKGMRISLHPSAVNAPKSHRIQP
jgi:hypothetical protein